MGRANFMFAYVFFVSERHQVNMNAAWRLQERTEHMHTPKQCSPSRPPGGATPTMTCISLSLGFQMIPSHSTVTPELPSSSATSPNKLLVLLKVKYHIDYSLHVLLNHLTRVKLCSHFY